MIKIKVKVTRENIKNGTKGECVICPVANALNEIPGVKFANVGCPSVNIHLGSGAWYGRMSRACQRWIRKFDNGKSVKPTNFIIEFNQNDY